MTGYRAGAFRPRSRIVLRCADSWQNWMNACRSQILTARFAPDAKTVVYGAAWDGKLPETFAVTADSPESRELGIPKSDVYAVSSNGELAISLRTGAPFPPTAGVLARVPLL